MKNLKYVLSHNLLNTLWNCRTSCTIWCTDPRLISRCAAVSLTVTRRFSFTMASTAAMPSGVNTRCAWPGRGESGTELMPFMNFLFHSYTCCSDRHASSYWTFIRRWISMGFTPSVPKNGWQNAFILWCILQADPPSLLLLRRRVAFLHRTATCRPLFKLWVSLLSSYRQSSCVSNFYRTFKFAQCSCIRNLQEKRRRVRKMSPWRVWIKSDNVF